MISYIILIAALLISTYSIAIFTKLNAHKNDSINAGLSTDHLIHAGPDISRHVSFLFTCMVLYLMNLVLVQFFLFLNLITVFQLIVRIFEALLLVLSSANYKIILS